MGDVRDGALTEFLTWRSERITRTVSRLLEGLQGHALRSALDVFTPALARTVGQDLAARGAVAAWCKSMTYLAANGPASMPYELKGTRAGCRKSATTTRRDSSAGCWDRPARLGGAGPRLAALYSEMSRLADMVGPKRAVVGLDAVQMDGVCEISYADLTARIEAVMTAGLGIAPSWDLRFISPARIALKAQVPGMRGLSG
jgi:hypothetical protein